MPTVDIGPKLVALWANASNIELPDARAAGTQAKEPSAPDAAAQAEAALIEIMSQLRARTGNDFQHYKRATVLRRLERRMQVTRQPNLPAYRDYLDLHLEETEPLLRDMLISVTRFFRDRDAFESLEREMAYALRRRPSPAQLRAWSVGCATGEEAYSLAMLLQDHVSTETPIPIQVFGTDIDEPALARARQGWYPDAIVTDVSPVRLRQYFQEDHGGRRVHKSLRDLVMFARQNILRDPPFSRLDLVCCRNLLIYLEREVQRQVLEMLHFALNPGGLLFLGSADSADVASHLFTPVDKKNRIYRAEVAARSALSLPMLQTGPTQAVTASAVGANHPGTAALHQRLLGESLSPCLLIDAQRNLVRIEGGASRFLRVQEGEPARDLLEMVQPELALSLRTAVLHAMRTKSRVVSEPVRLTTSQGPAAVYLRMSVQPAPGSHPQHLFVVRFDEFDADLALMGETGEAGRSPALAVLEQELQQLTLQLQGSLGDSASTTEALRASNEELQSINEELRSATEELETSKEELQSVNEELSTVNGELSRKVDETGKVNDDLHNLIVSMDMATVFVDRSMCIKRFTPRAAELFHLLPGDLGRPLSDLSHRLEYAALHEDVERVLGHLQIFEREVGSRDGRWHLVRISPYRRGEDRVDGAVINLIDVTQRRQVEERLRLVVDSTRDYAVITMGADGCITSWNHGAELMFGYTEGEILGEHFRLLFVPEERAAGKAEEELRVAAQSGRALDERFHVRKDGSRFYCSGITTTFLEGGMHNFAKIARDLTERQALETEREQLLARERSLRSELEAATSLRSEFLAIMSHELKNPLNLIQLNAQIIERSPTAQASPALLRAADIIQRTVRSQSQIIDDLLDLSRINTGKLTLQAASVSYLPIIERIVSALSGEAQDRGISLSFDGDPIEVRADAIRLEQIVWNLLSNALKFTPSGGHVDVLLRREGPSAVLTVRDSGRGIEPALLDRIFEMFEQGQRSPTTRRDGGLGIGLALVRQLAEMQGGGVSAYSEGVNRGATFTVSLPVSDVTSDAREPVERRQLQGLDILIVDDDTNALEAMAILLESEGARPVVCASAVEALRQVAAADFDLVVSDVAMPEMDGYELVAQLRDRPRTRDWPVVALTGFARESDAKRALDAGFDLHIPKPFSLVAITDAWPHLLRRKEH